MWKELFERADADFTMFVVGVVCASFGVTLIVIVYWWMTPKDSPLDICVADKDKIQTEFCKNLAKNSFVGNGQ